MSDTGKVFLGVLTGVAVGAALGVLFAPDKGSTTRRKISKKGEDYVDSLEDQFNGFVENVTQKFENLKDEVTKATENYKEKALNSDGKVNMGKNI
jgi:gas vesicle protein